jgi:cytochrome c556
MQIRNLMLATLLLASSTAAMAAGQDGVDSRYPVPVSPGESVQQKVEMRSNLVALRATLARLADKDFEGVEKALHTLDHGGPKDTRPGASTPAFRMLEREFEEHVNKTIAAARDANTEVVLRQLSETMAYCQSCHMSFRQEVGSTPGGAPAAH